MDVYRTPWRLLRRLHQLLTLSQGSGDRAHKCNRWAAWCAYVDPYYAGGGYDEYFGNDAKGKLDCHVPSTKWLLLGCYAQELYQWYEQISKHLW